MSIAAKYLFGLFFLQIVFLISSCSDRYNSGKVYQSEQFTWYPDRINQGDFEAKALSATQLTSNYQAARYKRLSPDIAFKFGINGKDNELPSGVHHRMVLTPEISHDTVSVKFGTPHQDDTSVPEDAVLAKDAKLTVRLDMREVFKAFDTDGFFTNFNGVKIYKEDFKNVYIAGNVRPLTWDFADLVNQPELKMQDPDGDHIYEVNLQLNGEALSPELKSWTLKKDISRYPQYASDYVLMDALYNLSLEELLKDTETDSTFRTGKEWAGVWTRDVSYSTLLSLAVLEPQIAKKSLLRKVNQYQRIIQDTGTGGAYPVSTDRVIWVAAAWEVYKVTGDQEWLKQSYDIIKNTLEDDRKNVYDPGSGLMRGETSFLDWREQTYPKWMQPVDIYESLALSTNVVHYQASKILMQMATLLGDKVVANTYKDRTDRLQQVINKRFWLSQNGYYGQYIYGRIHKILSDRPDALGESLSILFDLADAKTQAKTMASMPVLPYGIPCIYPQTPFIPAYHNRAIWPFVQSFWAMAAAKVANEQAVVRSLAAIYRPAALFLTNKENFVAENGDFTGTQVNSDEMLWSIAGNLSTVYRVLFGMKFQPDGLYFEPYIPKVLRGERSLKQLKYRQSSLDVHLIGYGNIITSATLDGQLLKQAKIPVDLKGKHELVIELADNELPKGEVHAVDYKESPDMPALKYENGKLTWRIIEGAKNFRVLKNGETSTLIEDYQVAIPQNELAEYQVITIDSVGTASFASAPYLMYPPNLEQQVEVEDYGKRSALPYKGYTGKGFVEISTRQNREIEIPIQIEEKGTYAMDFRYANGNGPINTANKCAIRTLELDGRFLGTVIFPQRGTEEWSDWGFSSRVETNLDKGKYKLKIVLALPANTNMNEQVNMALLDYLRLIKIK